MSNKDEKKTPVKTGNENASVKPDPETLHTPDPQKKMEGPISSLMQGAGEILNNKKTKEEADEEREKDM